MAIGICAAVALYYYYSLHSRYLAATLTRSMPYKDHWMFLMSDYFPYLQGKYAIDRLFAQVPNTEHRLLTTRLVLFADTIFFRMSGVFPVVTMYASLAAIAFMLARLAVQPASRLEHAAAFVNMLAVTWSISQYRDLSWQYEVQFPLLHVFALGALYALAAAFSRDGHAKYGWLAVALVCDFLAVMVGWGRRIFDRSPDPACHLDDVANANVHNLSVFSFADRRDFLCRLPHQCKQPRATSVARLDRVQKSP